MNTSGSTNKVAVAACPFCGGTDTACGIADEEFGRFWVECICGARGPTVETLKDARPAWNKRLAPEPAADVAALNRELCDKEGHVLGVIARPCLRCHAWFDPQYGKNMNLADSRDLSLFALMVLTNLTGATPATHPDTFKVAQQYADAWRSRQPETKEVKP